MKIKKMSRLLYLFLLGLTFFAYSSHDPMGQQLHCFWDDDYVIPGDQVTANVLAPLHIRVYNDPKIFEAKDWISFENDLKIAKSLGINGVSLDVWWGLVEGEQDNSFDWSYYDQIFAMIKENDLKIVPIMSFHQCGGNRGDNVFIPIPEWIWTKYAGINYKGIIINDLELQYKSEKGKYDPEVVSLWFDRLVKNEYIDFMNAFENHFFSYADDFIEINLSCGPSGELRYPAYRGGDESTDQWQFPHRGYLQCYSNIALQSFVKYVLKKYRKLSRVNKAWNTAYTSFMEIQPPGDTDYFFAHDYLQKTRYARDFITWYNRELVKHGRRMINYAHKAFNGDLDRSIIGIKIPGIHWQIDPQNSAAPRSAETCVGIINFKQGPNHGYGYNPIMNLVSHYDDVVLHFTCLEMSDQCESPDSKAKTLVSWVGQAARAQGVILKGENAVEWHNDSLFSWHNINDAFASGDYYGLTYLRMTDVIYGPSYKEYKKLIRKYVKNPPITTNPNQKSLVLHYKPKAIEGAAGYYLNTWAGLGGVIALEEEGDGWWKAVIKSAPPHFNFCFRDRSDVNDFIHQNDQNVNWDGTGRSYADQADEIYILGEDEKIYLSRPQ